MLPLVFPLKFYIFLLIIYKSYLKINKESSILIIYVYHHFLFNQFIIELHFYFIQYDYPAYLCLGKISNQ